MYPELGSYGPETFKILKASAGIEPTIMNKLYQCPAFRALMAQR